MKDYAKEIEELTKSHVYMKNPGRVNEIINNIVNGGTTKLQMLFDFDKTITKQHENGKVHLSSFGMFENCPSLTDDFKNTCDAMTKKYRKIEIDPTIEMSEKRKNMEEWWRLSEEALKGLSVSPKEIEEVCVQLAPSLRDGTYELFSDLHMSDVPTLVFSAGLGDCVIAVLKHFNIKLPNLEVISNFLKYDEDGTILGFKDKLIHIYNKNEYAIKGTPFFNKIANRENVILLGDSLGDASMAEGMEHLKNILKIGFLYERSDEALPAYIDTFDIVLLDDQTMDIPRAIFDRIKSNPHSVSELGSS
ncbi:unnamed protein product [Acanthoscelides obtectus]|uniref:5'-nucleotidase n=1 Tax=Acanthoscelides obtectus TaxID=200917 RepID=A0A9P0M8A8_ACAOB|nr:unnamed protein product [Acanthoscelides obtectus]CAK1643883.1 7-methylguanosine phosphate-specific 5'-nucleotidase [Acanthoscelides obtectus]